MMSYLNIRRVIDETNNIIQKDINNIRLRFKFIFDERKIDTKFIEENHKNFEREVKKYLIKHGATIDKIDFDVMNRSIHINYNNNRLLAPSIHDPRNFYTYICVNGYILPYREYLEKLQHRYTYKNEKYISSKAIHSDIFAYYINPVSTFTKNILSTILIYDFNRIIIKLTNINFFI